MGRGSNNSRAAGQHANERFVEVSGKRRDISRAERIARWDAAPLDDANLQCVTEADGSVCYYNGKRELHRINGPAVVSADVTRRWLQHGELHRLDGPAVEPVNGTCEWHKYGELHRDYGPAVERADGSREWRQFGALHRIDGFAVEQADGTREWYQHGQRHRDDGPAIERADGRQEWYRYGKRVLFSGWRKSHYKRS